MRLRTRTAYAFLTPYMLIFLAFWIWPIANSLIWRNDSLVVPNATVSST